jgi:hypothetical protein
VISEQRLPRRDRVALALGVRRVAGRVEPCARGVVERGPARAAGESLKTVSTDENTVGLDADFYRAGDGNDESFTAQMIVSADDIAPDIGGIQNVWIQGVGCASAITNFSS